MIRFLEHRALATGACCAWIRNWLKAGVVENGIRRPAEKGTPVQGAVISPLLGGTSIFITPTIFGSSNGGDAMRAARSWCAMPTTRSLALSTGPTPSGSWRSYASGWRTFALELHPGKTRLIEFGRQAASDRAARGAGKPETFDFLGFTHICSRSRRGGFLLARHDPDGTGKWRSSWRSRAGPPATLAPGHSRARGLAGRGSARFLQYPCGAHQRTCPPRRSATMSSISGDVRALRRRSQRDRTTWKRMEKLAERWPPKPRTSHPWPAQRFRVKHPRWEPYAGIPHVRFCAGGAQ